MDDGIQPLIVAQTTISKVLNPDGSRGLSLSYPPGSDSTELVGMLQCATYLILKQQFGE